MSFHFLYQLVGGIQHVTPFIALRIDSSWEHGANKFRNWKKRVEEEFSPVLMKPRDI